MSPPRATPRTEDGAVCEKPKVVKCLRHTRTHIHLPALYVTNMHTCIHLLERLECAERGELEKVEDEKEGKVMEPRGR